MKGVTAETETPQWYRIELIVFANARAGAGTEETWPQPQGLAYPSQWRLLDAEEYSDGNPPDRSINENDSGPGHEATLTDRAGVRSWHTLPEGSWLLADSAARLQRSGRYQVLFHEAWVQPLGNSRADSPAVLLAGGESFGDHHTLQGYITLSRERYIHADLELWLSEFRFGSGLETTLFSPLPKPPQRAWQTSWNQWSPAARESDPSSPESTSPEKDAVAPHIDILDRRDGLSSPPPSQDWSLNESAFSMGSVQYVPSQIFTLRQRQRIEPGQLTYIDHPLLGALLLVERMEAKNPSP